MENLERLDFCDCPPLFANEIWWYCYVKFKSLKHLRISGLVEHYFFKHLPKFPCLETLHLVDCGESFGRNLEYLQSVPLLREVAIYDFHKISLNDDLKWLPKLPRLILRDTSITDRGLASLSRTEIEYLDISFCLLVCGTGLLQGFDYLKKLIISLDTFDPDLLESMRQRGIEIEIKDDDC